MGEYTPTEEKYKGGAEEHYVTYDLEQETRGGGTADYPKVKRVYVPGSVEDWDVGEHEKESDRTVFGVKVTYTTTREGFEAEREGTQYGVQEAETTFTKIVELPEDAKNVEFRDRLPEKYEDALQDVR